MSVPKSKRPARSNGAGQPRPVEPGSVSSILAVLEPVDLAKASRAEMATAISRVRVMCDKGIPLHAALARWVRREQRGWENCGQDRRNWPPELSAAVDALNIIESSPNGASQTAATNEAK